MEIVYGPLLAYVVAIILLYNSIKAIKELKEKQNNKEADSSDEEGLE
jgi:hypothetical protein